MRKDLLIRYINGAMSNLERANQALQKEIEIPLQSSKVHGDVFKVPISATEARFLSDYLEAIAEKALNLADLIASEDKSKQDSSSEE